MCHSGTKKVGTSANAAKKTSNRFFPTTGAIERGRQPFKETRHEHLEKPGPGDRLAAHRGPQEFYFTSR